MAYGSGYADGYGVSTRLVTALFIETDPDVWYDITDALISGTITRGRQQELDEYQAGTCDLLLSNDDRTFDPTYAASPLDGHILPMKRIKVTASWEDASYPLFLGYADRWTQDRPGPHRGVTSLQATDGFKIFERANVAGSWSAQLSGARIDDVLDAIDWPAGLRDIDTGLADLQADDIEGSVLEHLQAVAETEYGNLFMTPDGLVRFEDRSSTVNRPATFDFSDAAGADLPITYSNPEISDELIRNDVTIARLGGTPQTVQDAASIAAYQLSSFERTSLYHSDDTYSLHMAEFIVQAFKDPVERVSQMTVNPYRDPDNLWPAVLGIDLGTRVTLTETPQWVTPAVTRTLVVEGITHTFSPKAWEATFNLSENAAALQGYWFLGVAGASELGETTRLYF